MTEEKNKYMAKQLAEALSVMRKRLNPEHLPDSDDPP